MRKSTMPVARSIERPDGIEWELSPQARERWAPGLKAATASATDNTISVLDAIGVDPWTGEGVTAKRIAAALRTIGASADVVVNINSPGGDLFEGLTIYNQLREHAGKVTVKVLGLAASAASLIAMAGDEIQIARAGFLMIHDTWVVALGNRNDLRDVADTLEPFDAAMADIYSARTGIDSARVLRMMDAETWINGSAAVDQGFADALLSSDAVENDTSAKSEKSAVQRADILFAKAGVSRTERRALLQELKGGTPSATARNDGTRDAPKGTPDAAEQNAMEVFAALQGFVLPPL